MKHCDYSLIDAYMLTRARRLNVLIQPNLKFLFELQGWEGWFLVSLLLFSAQRLIPHHQSRSPEKKLRRSTAFAQ